MKSKKKPVKKTTPKKKQGGKVIKKYSHKFAKPKERTKIHYITRIYPVSKIYKITKPFDQQDPGDIKGQIIAYEDGIQVCKFDCENIQAFDRAIWHLKALLYKEDRA